MKKLVILAAIALLAIGTVSAQGWGWAPPETVRVQGTLQLLNGQIVLSSGGTTVYYVPVLIQYVGFIDGLREGAQVTVEGYTYGNLLQPTKFNVGGRDYDLTANTQGWGGGYGYCPMWGGGRGGARGGGPMMRGGRW